MSIHVQPREFIVTLCGAAAWRARSARDRVIAACIFAKTSGGFHVQISRSRIVQTRRPSASGNEGKGDWPQSGRGKILEAKFIPSF
jgi:hypothetical protein